MIYYTTASIEIRNDKAALSLKDRYLFEQALQVALEEAAHGVLDRFGLTNEEESTVILSESFQNGDTVDGPDLSDEEIAPGLSPAGFERLMKADTLEEFLTS